MTDIIIDILITALYATVVESLVFSASYGLSESIRMAKKPKHIVMYGASVAFFSLSSTLICRILGKLGLLEGLSLGICFCVYIAVLAAIYILTGMFCKFVLKADRKYMNSLGLCAFNSLVAALPVINQLTGNSIREAVGLSIGAGISFVLSLLLIRGGMKHINKNEHIPSLFRGTPALFIYVSLIAMALSCISGGSLFL